jgi:hypothetical protein
MDAQISHGADELGAFSIPAFCLAYGISRSAVYSEIRAGRLKVMKVGTRTLISRRAATEWERACEQPQ